MPKISNTLTILSMFKDEARHAKEWVEHHRLEGVTDFLLLDNGSTDNSADILKGLGCRVIDYPERHAQEKAFNEYGSIPAVWDNRSTRHINTEWTMVIDFDEFVYAKNGYAKITDYLKTLSQHIDGVRLQWKLFGSSGHVFEPDSMIQGFTSRAPEGKELEPPKRWNYKTIYRNKSLGMRRKIYVHAPEPLGQVIYPVPYDPTDPSKSFVCGGRMECEKHVMFDESEKFLELNHYATGSLEDYMFVRSVKGDVNIAAWESGFRDYQYFKKLDFDDVHDDELYRKRSQNKHWEKNYPKIKPSTPEIDVSDIDNDVVFCYWDKGLQAMPEALQRIYFHNVLTCLERGMKFLLLTDDNISQYIEISNNFKSLKPNHKSDYVRWEFLNNHGGCWIDCDIILLSNPLELLGDHDLIALPELELTQEQYNTMSSNNADMRELLSSAKSPTLITDEIDYCKPGCCVLVGRKNAKVLEWAVRRMRNTINKVHNRDYDADGTIAYSSLPWHVLGPLVCAQALQLFSIKCRVLNQGREDACGSNAVTWKVNKNLPVSVIENQPGYDKSQWLLDTEHEARLKAESILGNPNAWVVPIWSIYRESDLEAPEDTLFNSPNSIYKYIIN